MAAIVIADSGTVIFGEKIGVKKLLAWMVNDFTGAVYEIDVTRSAQVDILKKLLDTGIIHVDKQNAARHSAIACQLDSTRKRNDPPVIVSRIDEQVLHMRRGEMQIFNPVHSPDKPFLFRRVDRRLEHGDRRRADKRTIRLDHNDTDKQVAVRLIEQVHLLVDRFISEVGAFDHTVIHRVRYTHHIAQIDIQVDIDLVDHTLVFLADHRLGGSGEPQIQCKAEKEHPGHRSDREGKRDQELDAAPAVIICCARQPAAGRLTHGRRPGCRGILSATCRTAF